MGINDTFWMKLAYEQALLAREAGEVPVGAVLVSKDNQLLGEGYNQVIASSDPTAHAEIVALRKAGLHLSDYRLKDTTLYVTLEPCVMCAGALISARIKRLVYAARDVRAGACGSLYNFLQSSALNHRVQIDEGILEETCSELLSDFFQSKRR